MAGGDSARDEQGPLRDALAPYLAATMRRIEGELEAARVHEALGTGSTAAVIDCLRAKNDLANLIFERERERERMQEALP